MEEKQKVRKRRRRKKRMPGWLKVLLTCFLLFIIAGLAFAVFTFYKLNQLGTSINEGSEERQPSNLRREDVNIDKKDPISIALFGVDSDESREGLGERSDSIMILSVNPNNDKTVMISIPRDTRTEIVGNDSVEKINHAYAYGGPQMAKDSIENLMKVPIDHYVSINMDGLKDLIDIVGGVTVVSNSTFEVKGNSYVEGLPYDMYGEEALAFTRSRYQDGSGGDFGRQERQQLVVEALGDKLLSAGSITRINSILDTLGNNVRTDLKMADIQDIGTKYNGARRNVERIQLEGTGETMEDGLWYFLPDEESLKEAERKYKENLEIE